MAFIKLIGAQGVVEFSPFASHLSWLQYAYSSSIVVCKTTSYDFRYHGEDDDRVSVASRKMTSYAKTDCVGASKGLFFGLLTLVSGLICLILFFVLIDHDNQQVRPFGALKKVLMKDVEPKSPEEVPTY